MKLISIILLSICWKNCFSQTVDLRGGRSLIPGIYSSLRYEHYTNSSLDLVGGVFMESSNKNNLRYRCYGLDILGQYFSNRDNENILGLKAGVGCSIQIENEAWIYRDLPVHQRINYGIIAVVAPVLNLSDAFAFSIFSEQKFLFNKKLGSSHFIYGVGLSYRLSQ